MTKNRLSLQEQIKLLEDKKEKLLDKRRAEILKIIERTGSLEIDDRILAGALLFLGDTKNKNHHILKEFESYIPASKKAIDTKKKD